jgi:hypothetical protein
LNGASESGAAAGRGHLPRHIQLTPGEEVLLTLRPWILIVWWKHVLTLGLYEFWRSRHVLALTSKRAVATQGFIVSKFDRFVPLERFQDATRERTWFWAYVRVSTAGGELGDKTKSSELRWGPYSPLPHADSWNT